MPFSKSSITVFYKKMQVNILLPITRPIMTEGKGKVLLGPWFLGGPAITGKYFCYSKTNYMNWA